MAATSPPSSLMARYKYIDTNPRFLPVDLARQLLPGTFEHALNHLLDHAIDLSSFDGRFRNDETGATAYPPAMLLKVVLFAYSQGIVSSRGIERVCREHVTFIALCGDTSPHFTTIAHFVSTLGEDIARVFAAVVAICDAQGLIGREMFAIDGVKLPSNASKHRSGTRADSHSPKALAASARPGQLLFAITRTGRSMLGSASSLKSIRAASPMPVGTASSRGSNPIRTTRRLRPAPIRTMRYSPRSFVRFLVTGAPDESRSVSTALEIGRPVTLSRTTPAIPCAAAEVARLSEPTSRLVANNVKSISFERRNMARSVGVGSTNL